METLMLVVIAALIGALAAVFGADSREFGERDRGLWPSRRHDGSVG